MPRLPARGKTTVPQEVRALLHIKPGAFIAWEEAANGEVRVKRMQPADMEYLRAVEDTLSEWASPADEEAYRDL
ncbi:MAG: AbrB family transcriptional regulator [Thermodesulfobacteriota bacterium]